MNRPALNRLTLMLAAVVLIFGCSPDADPTATTDESTPPAVLTAEGVDLDKINLPDGFSISLYAVDLPNARSMARSDDGTLFVSTRRNGSVYAVRDTDGDRVADEKYVLAEGLNMPNGVAFRDGSLYVAEVNRLLRYDDIENRLDNPPAPVVIYEDLPTESHHGWKFIAFGPDDKLYVPVGAPCNICDEGDPYATILRMNPDGSEREVYARGVRNTVGFTWHPETGELWFTDNGRDNIGGDDQSVTDNSPPCELNRITAMGQHFGYPHYHGGTTPDPEYAAGHSPDDYVHPVQNLGPHVAPLGMEFYTGTQFPGSYRNQALIAEHGSWNRSDKIGYRVTLVTLDADQNATSYEPFADGWLVDGENWGRPVDLEPLPDGSMLLSDDQNGVIYRISYTS